ncbi:cysteine-rich repeat secretory protein 38-like [Momordica charantia]|uniref:Cysteine-rich repeat secretory protein 38-like n=1 Tax=Momordica charantia TaxID=3673 RepID=A0A6J1CKD8_MOMCH|nr:cysteine-rich repeat secretory protein 38-like [Momordica charantia]
MEIPTTLFLLISLVLLLPQLILSTVYEPDFFFSKCSDKFGNYSNNSPFKKNLHNALASISSRSSTRTQVSDYGFYKASSGEEPDRANVKALCRGGVSLELCRICVRNSVRRILQTCPSQKEGAGWYGDCQIVYSNNSIDGEISVAGATQTLFSTNRAPDARGFNEALRELLDGLREKAASGSCIRKSASGDVKLQAPNTTYTIYGLADCFPDMSSLDCDVCLSRLQSKIPNCCSGSTGARLIATSCQINYEIHPLYYSFLSASDRAIFTSNTICHPDLGSFHHLLLLNFQ